MQGASTDVALQTLTVHGNVEYTNVLGGYDGNTASNPDAQIDTVVVYGDWIASNLVAGVQTGADNYFGTATNTAITGGSTNNPNIVSLIGFVDIYGQVQGTPSTVNSTDHFGFVAQEIGTFIYHQSYSLALTSGAGNDLFPGFSIGATGDVTVEEVPTP